MPTATIQFGFTGGSIRVALLDVRFLADLAKSRRPNSVAVLRTWCGSFDRWRRAQGRGFDAHVLRDYAAGLIDKGARVSTAETAIWAVRTYLRWLVERGVAVADQARPRLPRKERRLGYCPPQAAVDEIVRSAPAAMPAPYGTALALLPLTGMRISEMLGLSASDWQVVAGGRVVFSVRRTKTGDPRYVPVRHEGEPVFRTYLIDGRSALLGPNVSSFLFPHPRDPTRPVDGKGMEYHLRAYRVAIGCPELTPHSLRRAFVTWAMRRPPRGGGLTDQQAMKIIGHTNPQTFRLYYRPAPEDVADLVTGG